jgi:3',5'-cyclic AMP phosphodiesterase CpdA
MTFNIQYVSDLHLEHHDSKNEGYIIPSMFLKPAAPYLALCGDIGNPDLAAYEAFLSWCSKSYKMVFLVAGNHEYYNYRSKFKSDIPSRKEKIRSLTAKYTNVYFLDCSSYFIADHNLRVLGCTLWADTSSGDEMKIITYMNDTRNIFLENDVNLLPTKMTALHREEKEWLRTQIEAAEKRGEDVLVLTHYLPTFQLIHEKYQGHHLNICFASDCEDLLKPPVKAWLCGHSHTGVRIELNGVLCTMNPYGYPGEKVETRNRQAVLAFETRDNVVDV